MKNVEILLTRIHDSKISNQNDAAASIGNIACPDTYIIIILCTNVMSKLQYNTIQLCSYIALYQKQVLHESVLCYTLSHCAMRGF